MKALLWILSIACVAAGIAGTLLPALPGAPLVFGGLLLAAWIDGFQKVGLPTIMVLAVLTGLSIAVDFISSMLGAQRVGASRTAVIGAAAGTVIGLFFGLPGIVFGPFIGAVLGEYRARRDLAGAGRAGFGTWLGFIFGAVTKLVLAFVMVGIFVAAYII
jgi:uncharacterized protein YqgC (DUF456 family)